MSQYAKWETLWEQIVFPLAFVVVAGIAVAIYFENRTNRRETEELRTNGITTMGSLAHSYTQRERWGRSEYELTYTFDANGNTFSKTVTVDQPPTVSDVKIVYLPSPDYSRKSPINIPRTAVK